MPHDLFNNKFDPFDALVQLNTRLHEVEKKHNALVQDYQRTQHELSIALESIQSLQQAYIKMAETITLSNLLK